MAPVTIALLAAGIALVALSSLGMLLAREPFDRLHFLAPASTLGAPLVCLAVMLDLGAQRTTAKVAVIAVLVAVVQPAITAATGRATAAGRGLVSAEDEP
jgi:multicomponent Na+:H+ antiporter subunit G